MSGDPLQPDRKEERERSSCHSAREFEIKGKTEEKTGWRGQSESQKGGEKKRNGKLGAAETSKELAE